ncbi:nucleoside-diphosphate kinase [Enterococcus raffinosus]|uniref:nucleoside-diphosphate kinase n=1 Tax=Enterococcus raffinosus TaxID=71452 RepID=UPI001C117888|nr:nucleoside-diphosphate kinase [Enterococcus raffinosus]
MEQTVVIIKPDGVKRKLIGRIIQRLEDRGLVIKEMQQRTLDVPLVKAHYAHLKDKPFFDDLLAYMTSGPVVVMIVEQKEVIRIIRTMIGTTNALEAAPGTIRGDFALNGSENIIHASDSPEAAAIEIQRFFPN